ncbi:MAG TPA: hypothetical protein VFQ96_05745 [Microbacteriaceae bacterium]|nr:hypothetical protein [Microbacteriaceae bacterium]
MHDQPAQEDSVSEEINPEGAKASGVNPAHDGLSRPVARPLGEAGAAEAGAAEAGAEGRPGPSAEIRRAQVSVRRSPRYGRFIAIVIGIFIVASFFGTFLLPVGGDYTQAQVFGYLVLLSAALGLPVGSLIALAFDRALKRTARTLAAERTDIRGIASNGTPAAEGRGIASNGSAVAEGRGGAPAAGGPPSRGGAPAPRRETPGDGRTTASETSE